MPEAHAAETLPFTRTPSAEPTSEADRQRVLAHPGFGQHFTDHMVTIRWSSEQGWHNAALEPYRRFELDPATSVLHYAQAVFEGLKAYRQPDHSVAAFRPEQNARRLNRSARRLAMPELPEQVFLDSLREIVAADHAWVPESGSEEALYLRPFLIATEVSLGVNRPANSYLYTLIASPAGSYFQTGVKPVTVWWSEDYVRAAPGGTGEAKFSGNYAASFAAQAEAVAQGCDQVVWLDAVEHSGVEEMGGMNLFFVFGSGSEATLVTPELTGTLLPGVTRDSVLQLGHDFGLRVEERRVTTQEWAEKAASGELTEVFACGTAAVITPVGRVKHKNGEFQIADGGAGAWTMELREQLTQIQQGKAADKHAWLYPLS